MPRLEAEEYCPFCFCATYHTDDYRNDGARCIACIELRCGTCGDALGDNREVIVRNRRGWFCNVDCDTSRLLQAWNTSSSTRLLGRLSSTTRQPTFGVELEMACLSTTLPKVLKVFNSLCSDDFAMLKEDGSIVRGQALSRHDAVTGFEIVSRPFTWNWWSANKTKFYSSFKKAASLGARSHKVGSCGLHVHVGNLSLSARMGMLHLIMNDPQLSVALSRREDTSYCLFSPLTWRQIGEYCMQPGIMSRYSACHYSKYETIELRFFRGTLNHHTVQACLEYTRALAQYCTAVKVNTENTQDDFLVWLDTKQHDYPAMVGYMRKRQICA